MGPAVGAALSRQLQNKPGVAVSFLGEGAVNQGAFHESLNLASVWKLPVIFIIEDNDWGISVSKKDSTAVEHNHIRAAAYGMPGHFVPDNDPEGVFAAAGEAIARARRGEGPSLIEIQTSRLAGHFMGDAEDYRPAGEKDALFAKDPIPKMKSMLSAKYDWSESDDEALVSSTQQRVNNAIQFARDSDYPEPIEALEKVFV